MNRDNMDFSNKIEIELKMYSLITDLTDVIIGQGLSISKGSKLQYSIALLTCKAYKTFKAIATLCKEGYGQDAGILLRTLCDIHINLAYLIKDKNEIIAERYLNFTWLSANKTLETYYHHNLKEKGFKMLEEGVNKYKQEIKENYEYFKGQYEQGTWSGKSIEAMAKDTGLVEEYDIVFCYFTNFVHANSVTERAYLKVVTDQIVVDIDPSDELIDTVLFTGNLIFEEILTILDNSLNLGHKKEIDECKTRVNALLEQKRKAMGSGTII